MSFFKSRAFHNFLGFLFSVGGAYVAARYPQYVPLIGAGAGALGLGVTNSAYSQDPNAKP